MYVNVLGVLTATHSLKKAYTFRRFIRNSAKQYARGFLEQKNILYNDRIYFVSNSNIERAVNTE